jgi:hypothetical protein
MKCIHCRKVLGKYGAYYLRLGWQPYCKKHWRWMSGKMTWAERLERYKAGEVTR